MRQRNSVVFPLAVASLLALGWLAGAPAQAQSVGEKTEGKKASGERKKERDDVRRREEWFYRQRRYPLPTVPGGARLNALQQREANRREQEGRRVAGDSTIRNSPNPPSGWT
ncbi:MAG TPA: hypothetical protein VEG63_13225, partial [Candidatus Acidoferrales bacterium]|nr:hypothetical protein [Candidatus Acidoferrales bacterium]